MRVEKTDSHWPAFIFRIPQMLNGLKRSRERESQMSGWRNWMFSLWKRHGSCALFSFFPRGIGRMSFNLTHTHTLIEKRIPDHYFLDLWLEDISKIDMDCIIHKSFQVHLLVKLSPILS